MGGRALKNTFTRRYDRAEFEAMAAKITNILEQRFKRVGIPLFYKKKETFGDLDVLVSTEGVDFNLHDYIKETFNPNEMVVNGDVYSFDHEELQIDIIKAAPQHFDSSLMYFSYNDLGNFIGRLAHGFGLRYGQEGLWYEHQFKNQNIGDIPISKDYRKIYEFLGLSYDRYLQGFDELVDIFEFIASSPYFNWKRFQLSELNKINRDRNKKRASYMSFLEWMDANVADEQHEYQFESDKSAYHKMIDNTFSDARLMVGIKRLEYLECRKLYVQAKFNGSDLMKKYDLVGAEIGEAMSGFRTYITETYQSYNDFIIHSDIEDIYDEFETWRATKTK